MLRAVLLEVVVWRFGANAYAVDADAAAARMIALVENFMLFIDLLQLGLG